MKSGEGRGAAGSALRAGAAIATILVGVTVLTVHMCSGPWPASGRPCDAPRGMVRGSACGPPPFAEIRTDRGSSDNPLWAYFDGIAEGPVVDKWKSYFDVYHRHFSRFRGGNVNLLEIGVQSGGSIGMWQQYFGDGLHYYGVDINYLCAELFDGLPGVRVIVGDQANKTFWEEFLALSPTFDIIIDDGGHTMIQQITTFEALYPSLAPNGIYMVEDMETSYNREYGGGFRAASSFAEYTKPMVDHMNGFHARRLSRTDGYPTDMTLATVGFHVYDNICVWEKGTHTPPAQIKRGSMELPKSAVKSANWRAEVAAQRAKYRNTSNMPSAELTPAANNSRRSRRHGWM